MSLDIEKQIARMSLDELCGQLLCYEVSASMEPERFEECVKRTMPGAIFINGQEKEFIKTYTDLVNRYTPVPVIVAADVENGPGSALRDGVLYPNEMAWGACDDEALIERAGEVCARICRKAGIHWTFSPVVDLNYNPNNPVVNIRAISDSPAQVGKIASAFVRGLQKEGLLMAACKHFPGDGMDDRNQHFCTTVNPLSREEWMRTYGEVYKRLIESNVASVMSAHIALPSFEETGECLPATLSESLQSGLLKQTLGFEGCVVSDAISMIGISAAIKREKLAAEFVRTGGDVLLFALPEDFDYLKSAVLDGTISMERLKDAVRRVLTLKQRARLFENQQELEAGITGDMDARAISDEIGEKSIKIVRNLENLVPLTLKKGARILFVNLQKKAEDGFTYVRGLETLEQELVKRGFAVTVKYNPGHYELKEIKDSYDCILINCKISSQDYPGGSLRMGWDQMMAFWRGYVLEHPCVIFTAFGDPYKIYEVPFVKTYINAFSYSESTQKGFVKVLLGEIPETAKSPVGLEGFFDREVG